MVRVCHNFTVLFHSLLSTHHFQLQQAGASREKPLKSNCTATNSRRAQTLAGDLRAARSFPQELLQTTELKAELDLHSSCCSVTVHLSVLIKERWLNVVCTSCFFCLQVAKKISSCKFLGLSVTEHKLSHKKGPCTTPALHAIMVCLAVERARYFLHCPWTLPLHWIIQYGWNSSGYWAVPWEDYQKFLITSPFTNCNFDWNNETSCYIRPGLHISADLCWWKPGWLHLTQWLSNSRYLLRETKSKTWAKSIALA